MCKMGLKTFPSSLLPCRVRTDKAVVWVAFESATQCFSNFTVCVGVSLKCRFSFSMSGRSPRFCVSNELSGIASALKSYPTLGEVGFRLKPYVVRWERSVLRREEVPFSTQLPNTRVPWVGYRQDCQHADQHPGLGAASWATYCARRIIVFHVLGGGNVWGALQSSETPHQLSEVWTLGRRGWGGRWKWKVMWW